MEGAAVRRPPLFHITTFNPAILGRMVLKGIENGYAVPQGRIRGGTFPGNREIASDKEEGERTT